MLVIWYMFVKKLFYYFLYDTMGQIIIIIIIFWVLWAHLYYFRKNNLTYIFETKIIYILIII
jgi:hypothetical protein